MIISDKSRHAAELVLGIGALAGILPALVLGLGYAMLGEAFYDGAATIVAALVIAVFAYLVWDCVQDYRAGRLF